MVHSDSRATIATSGFPNGSRDQFPQADMTRPDMLAAAPGILSMLKTSIDIGDVGSLAVPLVSKSLTSSSNP
jgi:hypothetical protein